MIKKLLGHLDYMLALQLFAASLSAMVVSILNIIMKHRISKKQALMNCWAFSYIVIYIAIALALVLLVKYDIVTLAFIKSNNIWIVAFAAGLLPIPILKYIGKNIKIKGADKKQFEPIERYLEFFLSEITRHCRRKEMELAEYMIDNISKDILENWCHHSIITVESNDKQEQSLSFFDSIRNNPYRMALLLININGYKWS